MSQRLHSRSNGAAVKVPATTPVNATLDRSPLLRRLGDYAVAFATAALRSHSILTGGQCLSFGYQPEIAQAVMETEWRTGRTGTFQTCRRFGAHLSPRI
jgi:hypothetical protein